MFSGSSAANDVGFGVGESLVQGAILKSHGFFRGTHRP